MSLKYTCPICGTPLGYKGLCWNAGLSRSEGLIVLDTGTNLRETEKPYSNIQRLGDVEALEFTDFRQRDGLIYPLLST